MNTVARERDGANRSLVRISAAASVSTSATSSRVRGSVALLMMSKRSERTRIHVPSSAGKGISLDGVRTLPPSRAMPFGTGGTKTSCAATGRARKRRRARRFTYMVNCPASITDFTLAMN
jgi:hypothetical protein